MSEKQFIIGKKMSEKRFIWKCDDENCQIYDTKKKKVYFNVEVVDLLNEQQDIINDLNGELEESSAFIIEQRKEIQTLKEENKQLRNELNDCEKFRYAVFKRMEEIW